MENTNDNALNIQQIILHNGKIYLFKFVVFILVTITVFIGFDDINKTVKDFIGTITFVATTAIDCTVLAKPSNIKGSIVKVHLAYLLLLYLSVLFVILVFMEIIPIKLFSICICDLINIFCCISPLIELAYEVMSHVQNEKINNY